MQDSEIKRYYRMILYPTAIEINKRGLIRQLRLYTTIYILDLYKKSTDLDL